MPSYGPGFSQTAAWRCMEELVLRARVIEATEAGRVPAVVEALEAS